jgi:hypothetical protein
VLALGPGKLVVQAASDSPANASNAHDRKRMTLFLLEARGDGLVPHRLESHPGTLGRFGRRAPRKCPRSIGSTS